MSLTFCHIEWCEYVRMHSPLNVAGVFEWPGGFERFRTEAQATRWTILTILRDLLNTEDMLGADLLGDRRAV